MFASEKCLMLLYSFVGDYFLTFIFFCLTRAKVENTYITTKETCIKYARKLVIGWIFVKNEQNMCIKERLLQFAEARKLTKAEIERLCGLGRNSFNNSKSMSSDALARLLLACPDLSAEWLMRGIGPMFKTEAQTNVNNFDLSRMSGNAIKVGDNNTDVNINNDDTLKKLMEMQQQLIDYVTKQK